MKKAAASDETRYQSSANLFQFCRRVLDHKFGGIRVIDQDVGQILGFDPADCSHWKKGKKNVRSIHAMKSIAEHLGVDEKLVVDVASGDLDDAEAFYEFSGYGAFHVDPKIFEAAKKDFYRRHAGSWTKERENEFRDYFSINEPEIERIVQEIHNRVNFQEAPLYLPEIVASYPELSLAPMQGVLGQDAIPVSFVRQGAQTAISYIAGTEMRPYIRYRIAKAMAAHFLHKHEFIGGLGANEVNEYTQHLADVQANMFAARLLAPARLVRREIANVNVAKDVVAQLAEIFWVSKTFMNRRLKEIVQQG